ncbi:unnamed protein product [Rotaria sordida]|uniref:Uncharacterized protein n=1 Tax=Rotaria sordida TaxID=392033 RepID=A0A813UDW0_9BILA|nr:unnamed protein product [Rotaria sordida]CAF1309679.1 unnamed protein product [Rotaria sordida]CAF1333298.1 unnamed protein product [Rotaria sordida]CAF3632936.1 unnamed protein product [Rotaria sordida]CAF3659486.1 unnamed protein product [Rotaria sordida]
MVSTSVAVAEVYYNPRTRKLSNVAWLSAPHFQALTKRGRFVFREASNEYLPDAKDDDVDNSDPQPDKRNWRL